MKTKKNSVIIILSILVLLSISIGTLSFYKSEVSTSISSTWNNSKSISKYNNSNDEISFPTIPIIVVYKAKKVGDINSQNPVIIDISDKDFGLLWFPIIKISNYNFSITCNDIHEIKTDSVLGQFIVKGEINISGHYKIIGSCSTEIATNMVVDKVLNDIFTEIKKNIK
jgi:hypothetical protein